MTGQWPPGDDEVFTDPWHWQDPEEDDDGEDLTVEDEDPPGET